MKKIFVTILFASVALGATYGMTSAQPVSDAERRQLILKGARLWPIYCNQCHNARPPSEKAPHEWDIEIMHMRSLGNIPGENMRALLEYLKSR
jgi:hypothetical protein